MKNVICALEQRGFIDAMTSSDLKQLVENSIRVYVGFDPTADSLHIGNLVGIMGLRWFQKFGHTPIAVVGGATGIIGDPSGRSTERNLLNPETLEKNLKGIKRSLESVLDFKDEKTKPLIINNYDWYKQFNIIDFLRDIGRYFRLGTMLSKDSVKNRMNTDEGISFTEFSYQLLQAYDFYFLFEQYGVLLQMGGSDQWGNITAGTELIRKISQKTAHGLTFPLLTRSDGKKFGKTEEGAVWLNSDRLPVYDFYQYFYRIPDADVIKLMKMLTFMEIEEIENIEKKMCEENYVPNSAQKKLAEEVTKIVHGDKGLEEALKITVAAAPGSKTILDESTLQTLAHEIPTIDFSLEEVLGTSIVDLLVKTQCVPSKSEARRLITGGGIYLNNEKVINDKMIVEKTTCLSGRFLLISVGKKKKILVQLG